MSADLFGGASAAASALSGPAVAPLAPLAERIRPRAIDEVIGQRHLLAAGQPLALAFASRRAHSMLLWGPPGVGKTTLARLMAEAFGCAYLALSAVLAGVKDIRDAVAQADLTRATSQRQTLLFIDEIHRFNKSQQDALLPHVESGLFVFVGATTENPSFEVNSALLSRASVYVLHPLDDAELQSLIDRALEHPAAPELHALTLSDAARAALVQGADGDARRLLNQIELVARAATGEGAIGEDLVARVASEQMRRFDKGGDVFYDAISALHKSVRGSDPDASLYWFCRMIDGGADARYIARRMVRMASEDIGLADPRALRMALDAAETYERLGSPEGELALAQAVVYLAIAPKSNAIYEAYKAAARFVKEDGTRPVPVHLRNAPTRLMKELGYGREYRYAHDEPGAYAAGESYWPDGVAAPGFYVPTDRGLEARIAEKLAHLRALDRAALERSNGDDQRASPRDPPSS